MLVAGVAGALILSVIGSGATAGAGTPSVAGAPSKVRLGRAPRLPAGATAVSSLSDATALSVDVVLQPRDPVGLTSFAEAVSTPGSSQYQHAVTVREFVHRFGPTESTIAAVRRALASVGLRPGAVGANHLSIPVRATAGQLAAAFSTGFTRYRVNGDRIAYANTAAPQISGSVAPFVQGVVGLDDLSLPTPAIRHSAFGGAPAVVKPKGGTGGPQACSTAATDAADQGSYTTDQVASAYGFPDLYAEGDLGAGQTVALYELQGYGSSDITAYESCFGTDTAVTTVDVDGGPLAHAGVDEADVDIEQITALAPDAHILVYEGPNSDSGGYDTYDSIVSQDVAKVISTSWGECEAFVGSASAEAEDTLFEEAAAQGQSIVAASGDQGSEDCVENGAANGGLAVDDPASQPFVTGAGGTSWTAVGTPPTESAWNDGPTCCWGAGGGGVSSLWAMPSYQTGSHGIGVINTGSSGVPCGAGSGSYCREVPDVSALAGPYPYMEYVSGSWGSWGGTSLAAPLWASLMALSDASSACSGKDIGFANPVLYDAAAADPAAFNDITVGDNDLTGANGGLYPALAGYDIATGLGTPDAALLPALLCSGAAAPTVSVTDPGSQSTGLGTAVSLQIHAVDTKGGQTLSYSAAGLPTGISIDGSDGLITGSPTDVGTFEVLVTARDGTGASSSVWFPWSVIVAITSASSASAAVSQHFSFTVVTTGVPTSIKMTGKRPNGLKFHNQGNGTATLSGTPRAKDATGTYPLLLIATWGKGKSATVVYQAFTLTLTSG
jgi:subtilase family serine protease